MGDTLIVVALLLGLLTISLVSWALALRLGLHWSGAKNVRKRRIVAATAFVFVAGIVFYTLLVSARQLPAAARLAGLLGTMLGSVLVPWLAVAWIFRISLPKALLAWLPTLVASVAAYLFMLLVFRPFLLEGYTLSANSMAPVLLGEHVRGTCPECGAMCYRGPRRDDYPYREEPMVMICDQFHITQHAEVDEQVYPFDRVWTVKFLRPRRWELVAFRLPSQPDTRIIKRLVGLPGETIHIADGAVWADGENLTPPESLRGIRYDEMIGADSVYPGFRIDWGSLERPAKLGPDEYFVLGDFTTNSADSRLWREGAPGHPPYAVPDSYLIGVATHIYWPPERWRTLRE